MLGFPDEEVAAVAGDAGGEIAVDDDGGLAIERETSGGDGGEEGSHGGRFPRARLTVDLGAPFYTNVIRIHRKGDDFEAERVEAFEEGDLMGSEIHSRRRIAKWGRGDTEAQSEQRSIRFRPAPARNGRKKQNARDSA